MAHLYTDKYFEELQQGSVRSAREIVPVLLNCIRPRSVVDVGCGSGAWLSVFREYGVEDVFGIDCSDQCAEARFRESTMPPKREQRRPLFEPMREGGHVAIVIASMI